MLQAFAWMAERKIEDAMRRGEFDDLPGRGKKIVYEDDSMIPADLRMAYKILKNAGYVPQELLDEKEIVTATELLAAATDEQERYRQMQKLNFLIMKANARRRRPADLEKDQVYYRKVVERVTVHRPGKEESGRCPEPRRGE
jgi:hypothetical protein